MGVLSMSKVLTLRMKSSSKALDGNTFKMNSGSQ